MALNLKWSQHFQRFLSDFENKYALAQSHLSPIGYALSQKIIPSDLYIKWAQATYRLPVVTDDYFSTHLPSVDDWKSWKSEYTWSEEVVPLGIWDGHLLVACLEIPERFPASLYPIFLIADFKNTQRTYQFYMNSDKGSESAKKLKDLIKQPELMGKSQFEAFELSHESSDDEAPSDKEDELSLEEEQPEGLSLNFGSDSGPTNFESKTPQQVTSKTIEPKSTSNEISFDNLDILSTPPKEEISLKFTHVEVNSSATKKKASSENTMDITKSGMTSTKLGMTMTTIGGHVPSSIQNEINKGLPYFIAIKKDNPTNFENVTQSFFSKVSSLFDKSIVIAIDPSELHAIPVSWSDNVTPRSKDLEKLDLNEPSIFKIVASTLKSYHGYIVLNEHNEKFFEFWNQGQVPGNITMVPLIVRNKLVGMWMGLGESNTYNWNTLRQMETKSKELCETFTDMFTDSADAA